MKFCQWEIYLVNLDPVVGSEQGKTRPVLIISEDLINQILPIVNILPITSKKSSRFVYPNEVLLKKEESSLDNISIILSHQIRTVDKKRLIKRLGKITDEKLKGDIFNSLFFQIGYYK
ncbi:MAG: type II toxin-antitoxin system PemK/MazF family toxin [Candidatus Woesearchaeota archaeon]|jgi:mRNA interferase MazF|nr:type II toxin-antitoxin system PemK/MazF family toxin [Candidatus Woesearchaeota archaeon]